MKLFPTVGEVRGPSGSLVDVATLCALFSILRSLSHLSKAVLRLTDPSSSLRNP
jgi:hypothetical protein